MLCSFLQSHHLAHNAVRHADAANKDEHIKNKLPDIAPNHSCRRSVRIYHRRRGRKHGEDDTGQHDNRTLQAEVASGIGAMAVKIYSLKKRP